MKAGPAEIPKLGKHLSGVIVIQHQSGFIVIMDPTLLVYLHYWFLVAASRRTVCTVP
jgi:hypothetical protein